MNTIIYTTLIKGFSKTQQLDRAVKLYEEMKCDNKIKPNNVTFNSLIDCCVRCTNMENAQMIFEEMLAPESEVKPDLITYSTMVKGYCKIRNIEQAFVI